MLLPRDIPALVVALAMAVGSTRAMPVADTAAGAPKCNHNNCYLNLFDSRYFATAQSFCPGFLSGTTTAASAVPTAFKNCKDVSAVSSACSCVVYTAPATTTTSSTSTTSTSISSSSSSSTTPAATTPAPAAATCNHNNCYLNMFDTRYIATAQSFCPEFLASTTADAAAIPTAFKNCKGDIGKVSSACSCIVPATPTSTTPTAAPTCTSSDVERIRNGGFEDLSDQTSWSFSLRDGSGVTLGASSLAIAGPKARSGSLYVHVDYPSRDEVLSMSQTVESLTPGHEYTLTYYWGLVQQQDIYDGDCRIQTTADDQLLDIMSTKRVDAYTYFERDIVFTPSSPTFNLKLTFDCGGDYFYGTGFVLDDFSLKQSCPP